MPFFLKSIVRSILVVTPGLIASPFLPSTRLTIGGESTNVAQAWSDGSIIFLLIFVALLVASSWGMACRNKNSRWLAMAIFLVFIIPVPFVLTLEEMKHNAYGIVALLSIFITTYYYLFRDKNVAKYFNNKEI